MKLVVLVDILCPGPFLCPNSPLFAFLSFYYEALQLIAILYVVPDDRYVFRAAFCLFDHLFTSRPIVSYFSIQPSCDTLINRGDWDKERRVRRSVLQSDHECSEGGGN